MLVKSICVHVSLIWLLNAAFFYLVDGLKCYQCNSNVHTHCTEYLDKENANIEPTECEVYEAKYCVKTTGMYKGEVGTQRFCASVGWGDICEFVKRKGDYREYRSCVYTCSGNECNSSPSFQHSNSFLITTFVFIYFFTNVL